MKGQRFTGKTAIVTGSARGLGKATATQLSREGATVVVTDVLKDLVESTVDEINCDGGKASPFVADITDPEQVEAMMSSTVKQFGTLDILVNNAGMMKTTNPMEEIPLEEFRMILNINVLGVFLCMKYALPIMKENRRGKIVNLSSSAGRCMSTFCGAHYSASKAAILGLTRHSANEAAPYGVNINAIAPGSFKTEGGMELFQGVPEAEIQTMLDNVEKQIPMQRFGTPQDQAKLVAFLCSDESDYITGATVDINGGELMM